MRCDMNKSLRHRVVVRGRTLTRRVKDATYKQVAKAVDSGGENKRAHSVAEVASTDGVVGVVPVIRLVPEFDVRIRIILAAEMSAWPRF